MNPSLREWRFGSVHWHLGDFPKLMGIVNVTPDSFSDGGKFLDPSAAIDQALSLAEQGADILDLGAESTRPGATPVPASAELARLLPVLERLRPLTKTLISIDTMKATVARAALAAGADIVNDVSGLTHDPEMLPLCASTDCGVIVMHMQGSPATMQQAPQYENVVTEVCESLHSRIHEFAARGIVRERMVVDPGIGFGKTAEHNLQLLSQISRLRDFGRPVLIGHSRKRFLQKLLGRPLDERHSGNLGIAIACAQQSADILRVHDIAATRDALLAWQTLLATKCAMVPNGPREFPSN